MNYRKYFTILFVFTSYLMLGQTADVTEGCIPLLIKFQGPQSQSYFWDFGDNSNSTEQNPEHTYTSSGDYNVSLSEGQNGPLIGNILISVYPNLDIVLTSDIDSGCIPLDVQFTSTIIKDVGIAIDCLVWTMGDGAELTGLDLMHTYVQAQKELDVSIEAFTTPANCGDIFIFPDMVEAEDLNVLITPFGEIPCTEPATFSYTIDKEKDDRYDYQWDFGNGTTASGYDSGPVTYNNFGIYTVTLTISSPSGCIVTNEEVIQVGPPAITITHPDSVCIGQEFTASTATIANRYEWSYGDTLEKSLQTQITTAYYTPGLKPILLETFLNENCKSDTTVNVFVEVPDSDFTIQPLLFCSDTVDKTLVANVSSHNTYIWNDSLTTNSTFTIEGLAQERDSAYIPVSDTITATLEVISAIGCKSMTEREFASRLPEAYFIPDRYSGLNTLTVELSDFSKSDSKIVRRTWNYGDNTTQTFTDSTVVHSHTYDTCGVYPLTLEIENEDGCIHKTRARFMLVFGCVGEFTGTDSIPDISEDSVIVDAVDPNMICVNDRVIIPTPTSGLIETNVFMNQERLDYCWQQPVIIHTFDEPGIFFTHYTIDFLDIELARRNLPTYTVEGASSHLTHSMDCSSPRTVTLTSQANNATDLEWVYQGQVISTADSFELDITQPGEHTIYLFAENTPSGCPADVDSTVIYIQDPVADFSLPAEVCDSVPILLDASASSNVFSSCHQGYLWEFETHRPRETSEPILEHEFGSGDQTVRLIVEDINGCTDTIEKNIRAYGIDPAFEIDSFVCLPYTKLLQNNTVSDNAIISWDWNFGSTDYSPTYTFEEKDLVPGTLDTIEVVLAVEDAFGCVDTLTKIVRTFVPSFEIDLIGARVMCQGDSRKFFVIDSLGVEHLFDFEWDFYGVETVDTSETRHEFNIEGDHLVTLSYQQIGGGCSESLDTTIIVYPSPEACFTTDIDSLDFICAPAQVTFFPCDTTENNLYQWTLGDDASVLPEPSNDFGVGTHTIQMIVVNDRTCTDTLTKTITLSGSSGEITSDQEVICLDQLAQFDLIDTMNIGSILWDFGDGTIIEDQTPVTHTYTSQTGAPIYVKLILESLDGNCVTIDSIPITLSSVTADFVNLDSLNICDGRIRLQNLSMGANQYEWTLNNGTVNEEQNPILYGETGTQTIELVASNSETGCTDIAVREVTIPEQLDTELLFPNLFSPNGDGNNDFFGPAIPLDLEEEIIIRTFRIYNRWGQLVYDNTDPAGWNGIFNNKQAPPEVYAYYIELDLEGCDPIAKKGNVTLIR